MFVNEYRPVYPKPLEYKINSSIAEHSGGGQMTNSEALQ